LLIIGTIGNRKKIRFNELMKELKGISPKTLADRLKEQEEFGLINREAFAEIPPRVEYTLTQNGAEIRKAMIPLMEWVHQNSF
jgi:DNA-binding HxlR family transcriptional regulator